MESKLVSKSPILRFKLERKIVKFYEGGRYVLAKRGFFGDSIWADSLTGDLYKLPVDPNRYRDITTKRPLNLTPLSKGYLGKTHNYTGYDLRSGIFGGRTNTINGNDYIVQNSKNNPPNYSFMKTGTRQRSPEELQKWLNNVLRLAKILQQYAQPQKPVIKSPVNNVWIKGYDRRPEINDVRAMQLKLADMGLLKSRFGVDGKWGRDTEAAYLKYLALKTIPTMDSEPVEMVSPAQLMGIYSEENMPLHLKIGMVLKKGGQLPSRNPVERFKSNVNFFRLEVQ